MGNHAYHLDKLLDQLTACYDSLATTHHCFPSWKKHILQKGNIEFSIYSGPDFNSEESKDSIVIYNIKEALSQLREESQSWTIPIHSVLNERNTIGVTISRTHAFRAVLTAILNKAGTYGDWPSLNLNVDVAKHDFHPGADLTAYRIHLFEEITSSILAKNGYSVNGDENETVYSLRFTTKCCKTSDGINIYCAKVVDENGEPLTLTFEEYLSLRKDDVRATSMSEEWGDRDDDAISKLASASVVIDLFQAKPNNPVRLRTDSMPDSIREDSSKGAVFLFYNYARLVSIRKKFEEEVARGVYPPLPAVEDVDFSLLNQREEWIILFNYLLEYPTVIRRAVEKMASGEVSPQIVCVFAFRMCQSFSVYYRRFRILPEPKSHLFGTMFARIYLVSALEHVLVHICSILNISPIERM